LPSIGKVLSLSWAKVWDVNEVPSMFFSAQESNRVVNRSISDLHEASW